MGLGDELLGTGIARDIRQRLKKRTAFGDNTRIIWSKHGPEVFRGNDNIARPGEERKPYNDLEWVAHYTGNRLYNTYDAKGLRWVWNYQFKAQPGELFLSEGELEFANRYKYGDFVLIEPNVPMWKRQAQNKLWPINSYQAVVDLMTRRHGATFVQLHYSGMAQQLVRVKHLSVPSARHAFAVLARAKLYIGAEGGMHHAAAAFGLPAVVLFGGFAPPSVLGYETHANLTGDAKGACGSMHRCSHCLRAMKSISPEQVVAAAVERWQCVPSMT